MYHAGHISFDDQGRRNNYTLDVMEMTVKSEMMKVGRWSEEEGLVTDRTAGVVRYKPSNRKLA